VPDIKVICQQQIVEWMGNPVGNLAVATIPLKVQNSLATWLPYILMSPDTMAKQRSRHPELTIWEYISVFESIESGRAYQDGTHKVIIICKINRWYKSVIKATSNRNEIYLISLFRVDTKTLRKTIRLPEVL
jgi:hypothetical protein